MLTSAYRHYVQSCTGANERQPYGRLMLFRCSEGEVVSNRMGQSLECLRHQSSPRPCSAHEAHLSRNFGRPRHKLIINTVMAPNRGRNRAHDFDDILDSAPNGKNLHNPSATPSNIAQTSIPKLTTFHTTPATARPAQQTRTL